MLMMDDPVARPPDENDLRRELLKVDAARLRSRILMALDECNRPPGTVPAARLNAIRALLLGVEERRVPPRPASAL